MASLINDKDTARQFVRINFINDVSSLPDFQMAADRFLIPIIGQDQYDDLLAQVQANLDDDQVPVTNAELLAKCQAVIAPLGYLAELATIQTQLTDSGLRTANTDHLQAAHRWEYNEVKEHLADKGAFAIEALLKFLFAHKADYGLWTDSNEYAEASALVFTDGSDFNKYFRVLHPHRVWWELRPLISEVEDFYINTTIGKDFFTELKQIADPGAEEKEAISLIKKAVAQTTIVKAVEKMAVKITPQGFTVLISAGSGDAANSGDEAQKDNQLSLLYESCQRSGDAYLLQLQEYLNEKAAADLFTTYFNSDKYVAPVTTTEISKNACRKIFGL